LTSAAAENAESRADRIALYLANRGYDLRLIQDYLGHRDPKHTVHYTRTAASRFERLWR
jgi:type 1 fimbriae regulatory protein FimB